MYCHLQWQVFFTTCWWSCSLSLCQLNLNFGIIFYAVYTFSFSLSVFFVWIINNFLFSDRSNFFYYFTYYQRVKKKHAGGVQHVYILIVHCIHQPVNYQTYSRPASSCMSSHQTWRKIWMRSSVRGSRGWWSHWASWGASNWRWGRLVWSAVLTMSP